MQESIYRNRKEYWICSQIGMPNISNMGSILECDLWEVWTVLRIVGSSCWRSEQKAKILRNDIQKQINQQKITQILLKYLPETNFLNNNMAS